MAQTLLLDNAIWDLLLDAAGNIAVASPPYQLAQDAASAIKIWLGECYFDTTIGVPYLQQIFGVSPPPIGTIKEQMILAALTVPGIASAQVFITALTDRTLSGQVQVLTTSGQTSAMNFVVLNPQGVG